MEINKDYQPFGPEWKNEVKKLDKNTLINWWRKSLLELRDTKLKCKDLEDKLDALEVADNIIIGDYRDQIEELKKEKNRKLVRADDENLTIYYKSSTVESDNGFMMCACGQSAIDNKHYVVTTNHMHCDEIQHDCSDAKWFSELVAKLLNNYYNGANK